MSYLGMGQEDDGIYSDKAPVDRGNMTRLKRKIEGARGDLPQPIIREEKEQDIGIVYYGSMENTIQEIDDILESTGMKVSQCRVRALPLSLEIEEFVRRHKKVIKKYFSNKASYFSRSSELISFLLLPSV